MEAKKTGSDWIRYKPSGFHLDKAKQYHMTSHLLQPIKSFFLTMPKAPLLGLLLYLSSFGGCGSQHLESTLNSSPLTDASSIEELSEEAVSRLPVRAASTKRSLTIEEALQVPHVPPTRRSIQNVYDSTNRQSLADVAPTLLERRRTSARRDRESLHRGDDRQSLVATDVAPTLLERRRTSASRDRENNGLTPLQLAVQSNDLDAFDTLVERGADILERRDADQASLLHIAAAHNCKAMVDKLAFNYPRLLNSLNNSKHTPLHTAVIMDSREAASTLLEHYAQEKTGELSLDIDAPGKHGETPLGLAIRHHHNELAICLLDHGADANGLHHPYQITPLLTAATYGNVRMLADLHQRGASLDSYDRWGRHALHRAAAKATSETLQWLYERGAQGLEAHDQFGLTPLHYAAAYGCLENVQALLALGADPHTPIKMPLSSQDAHSILAKRYAIHIREVDHLGGSTALDIARNAGHSAIVEVLAPITREARPNFIRLLLNKRQPTVIRMAPVR